ncbi:hypothetical protein [Methylocapsa aurea]|uniref:hypothetical protein n=1 Tax=Methylocapsa aurea TaxID=663610 RepID=UPI00138E13F6|nr:hypothetical protein [Methylocapsa aurea]
MSRTADLCPELHALAEELPEGSGPESERDWIEKNSGASAAMESAIAHLPGEWKSWKDICMGTLPIACQVQRPTYLAGAGAAIRSYIGLDLRLDFKIS